MEKKGTGKKRQGKAREKVWNRKSHGKKAPTNHNRLVSHQIIYPTGIFSKTEVTISHGMTKGGFG
jgi:hypothetical protein